MESIDTLASRMGSHSMSAMVVVAGVTVAAVMAKVEVAAIVVAMVVAMRCPDMFSVCFVGSLTIADLLGGLW
jgi:hypothetical protein